LSTILTPGVISQFGMAEEAVVQMHVLVQQARRLQDKPCGSDTEMDANHEQAALLLARAADMGSGRATWLLGVCYEKGDGVKKDFEKAVKLYTKADTLGEVKATVLLAKCYEHGRGVPRNLDRAIGLYQRAAARGDTDALQYVREWKG